MGEAAEERKAEGLKKLILLAVTRDRIELYNLQLDLLNVWDGVEAYAWNADGSRLALANIKDGGVYVYSMPDVALLWTLEAGGPVRELHFSPLSTYLVTLHRRTDETDKNLCVWRIDGESACDSPCISWSIKGTPKEWPVLKWTSEEGYCCKMGDAEIQVFNGKEMNQDGILCKIEAPNVIHMEPSPEPGQCVALCIGEKKGAPASVRIVRFDQPTSTVASKSFFRAQEMKVLWNFDGSACLVRTHSEVDSTGKSYYGSSDLYFLRSDGSNDKRVTTETEGTVHDVEWSPSSNEFLLSYGVMPAEVAIWDGKVCEKRVSLGRSRRNTIRWNPFGRFVAIAGFESLAGDIDFWDKNKKKSIGSAKAPCTVGCGWAPDGRHFFTSITRPRRRVDNAIKILSYTGSVVSEKSFDELYQVEWSPVKKGAFKDRPVTPVYQKRTDQSKSAAADEPAASAPSASSKPAGAYRPPGSSGALAARLRAERAAENRLAAKAIPVAPTRTGPPGAPPEAKSGAASRAERRSRRRARKKAEGDNADESDE